MKEIKRKTELIGLAMDLEVREDWHEPDEQGVSATVTGHNLDNSGCGPEIMVTITKDEKPVASIRLATLLAFATGWAGQERKYTFKDMR